jgi:hypothetical protein
MSNRQLGAELFISVNTAGVHVSRILTKLGLATRTEAAAFAHEHGLLADTGWPPAHGSTERDIHPSWRTPRPVPAHRAGRACRVVRVSGSRNRRFRRVTAGSDRSAGR